jgi:hypothetical protein
MIVIRPKDAQGYSTETHFNEIKWLAKALAKDDARFHVSHIWARKDGSALATDGIRMHVVEHCSLQEGFYRVVKQTRWSITLDRVENESGFEFPDVDDVINGANQKHGTIELMNLDAAKVDNSYCTLLRAMAYNMVRYPMFVDAISGMESFDATFDDSCEKAIYFSMPNRLAIVMPFRTED